MKPPYEINSSILKLVSSISEKIGQVNANYMMRPSAQLRKQNRVQTIHSSLQIEGNSLTEAQITAIIENKRVIGPEKDIKEVMNAIKVYNRLGTFKPYAQKSFLNAHKLLMADLVKHPGKYRSENVGIFDGSRVAHMAPPFKNVASLMEDLFDYLKNTDEIDLIKSCVFHYEVEFIHPFVDGNGRIGRLWQSVILLNEYPVFEFLPFETLIKETQDNYYTVLGECDKAGNSTRFIEYMLVNIDKSLEKLLDYNNRTLTELDRLEYFISLEIKEFTRKDYMDVFKDISSATASRDLARGVELKLLNRVGEKNQSIYEVVSFR